MKKVIKCLLIILGFILIIGIIMKICLLKDRTYSLQDFGIQITIPANYKTVIPANNSKRTLLSVYNEDKDICIQAVDVGENFWSSGDIEERMYQYLEVISAVNYQSSIINIKRKSLQIDGNTIGKVSVDLENINKTIRVNTIITEAKNGNIILEIYGEKENIEANQKEIENILKTIKITENMHKYEEKSGNIDKEIMENIVEEVENLKQEKEE